jgi:hypothetical protein
VQLAHKDFKVYKVQLVLKAHSARKVHKDQQARKV